eukprot:m.218823 g.218823  ORF g.218823 m.218823 type:complete len:372 (+) comp17225_c1_seq7:1155-2270(+)
MDKPRATIVRVKRRHDEDPLEAFSVYQAKRSKEKESTKSEATQSSGNEPCVYKRVSSLSSKELSGPRHIEMLRKLRDMETSQLQQLGTKSINTIRTTEDGKARRRRVATAKARQARFKRVEEPRLLSVADQDEEDSDRPHVLEIETVGVQADRAEQAMAAMHVTCNNQPTVSRRLSPEEQAARARVAKQRRSGAVSRKGGRTPVKIPIPVGSRAEAVLEEAKREKPADSECVFDYYLQVSGTTQPIEDIEFMLDEVQDTVGDDDDDILEDDDDSNDESNWRNEYPDENEYDEETPRDLVHDGWRDMPDESMEGTGRPLGWETQTGGAALLQSFRNWRQPTADQMVDDFGMSDEEQQQRYWGDDDDDDEEFY